ARRYAEVEQSGRWGQDLLPSERSGNPLERIATLRVAHSCQAGTAAHSRDEGVPALAGAETEYRTDLRRACTRGAAVWQGGVLAAGAERGDERSGADGTACRSESVDGTLLPGR